MLALFHVVISSQFHPSPYLFDFAYTLSRDCWLCIHSFTWLLDYIHFFTWLVDFTYTLSRDCLTLHTLFYVIVDFAYTRSRDCLTLHTLFHVIVWLYIHFFTWLFDFTYTFSRDCWLCIHSFTWLFDFTYTLSRDCQTLHTLFHVIVDLAYTRSRDCLTLHTLFHVIVRLYMHSFTWLFAISHDCISFMYTKTRNAKWRISSTRRKTIIPVVFERIVRTLCHFPSLYSFVVVNWSPPVPALNVYTTLPADRKIES